MIRRWAVLVALGFMISAVPASSTLQLDLPETSLTEDERIVHVLNRLGFGPRPGDVERVRQHGLEEYLELQLTPELIPDGEVDRRLAGFETLRMSAAELLVAFPPPQLLRGIERNLTSRMGMDPAAGKSLFPELDRREERKEGQSAKRKRYLEGPARIVTELSQAKLVRAIYSERQLQEVLTDFWFNHFNVFIGKGAERWLASGFERDTIRPNVLGGFRELLGETAHSPAMLFYLDNWLSSAPGSQVGRHELQPYATRAIREQGMPPGGVATLILRDRGVDTSDLERRLLTYETMIANNRYLPPRFRAMQLPGLDTGPRRRGLNENYARELLELHTLGVDGGYTQDDIIAVARVFTGWSLLPMHAGQGFVYVPQQHDGGKKVVLGRKVKGRGMQQGEQVLGRLALHPSTARFVSHKLALRFVSDEPPESLVEAMAETFRNSAGDIRQVLIRMLNSEEFWDREVVRSKVKTPLELVVSAVRATGGEMADLPFDDPPDADERSMQQQPAPPGLVYTLRQMGQPLYGAQAPTGYDETAEAWVSTGALLNRMKFGLGLAGNRIPGVSVPTPERSRATADRQGSLTEMGRAVLGVQPSEETVRIIEQQLTLDPATLAELGVPRRFSRSASGQSILALGWYLASAEFQRR